MEQLMATGFIKSAAIEGKVCYSMQSEKLFHNDGVQQDQKSNNTTGIVSIETGNIADVVSMVPINRLCQPAIQKEHAENTNFRKDHTSSTCEEKSITIENFLTADTEYTSIGAPELAEELSLNRKVLPHKKRISRRLRRERDECSRPAICQKSLPLERLTNSSMQFMCELCNYSTFSQQQFFAHLKQHYEPQIRPNSPSPLQPHIRIIHHPTSSDNMSAYSTVKSGERLSVSTKSTVQNSVLQTSSKVLTLLDNPLSTVQPNVLSPTLAYPLFRSALLNGVKQLSQSHNESCFEEVVVAMIDQVLRDVQLTFDDFASGAEDADNDTGNKIKNFNAKSRISYSIPPLMSSSSSRKNLPLEDPTQEDTLSASETEIEFSENEDMMQEIRNVVDKVSLSVDTSCDDIDVMDDESPAEWFGSNSSTANFGELNFARNITLDSRSFEELNFEGSLTTVVSSTVLQTEQLLQSESVVLELVPTTNMVEHSRRQLTVDTEMKLCNADDKERNGEYYVDRCELDTSTVIGHRIDSATNEIEFSSHSYSSGIKCNNNDKECCSIDENEQLLSLNRSTLTDKLIAVQQPHHVRVFTSSSDQLFEKSRPEIVPFVTTPRSLFVSCVPVPVSKKMKNAKPRYGCSKCDRRLNSKNALRYHERTHSGDRPFQCNECKRTFVVAGALKSHLESHTGVRRHECAHCQRRFRLWTDLKHHLVSRHSEEKNHQCEYCGKAFARKYSLVLHRRIHTNERNYACEFCTKTFRANVYLQNHRRTHTGEKPYECAICLRKFRVSGDLTRHLRTHLSRT